MPRFRSSWLPCIALGVAAAGCGGEDDDRYDPEEPFTEGVLGTWQAGLTVGAAGGCSTAIVRGLAQQLIDEINCLRPNTLVVFSRGDINEGEAVWPYLQGPGVPDLHAALDQRGRAMSVNSALRTLPQQYLLYKWYQEGACNIGLAARPGRSPHESGKALDIEDHGGWQGALENHGFDWHGNDDPVHFDYVGAGTVDLSGLSVQAFQRLWNRNHPDDAIAEDGQYGPQTEGKLRASPTDGFDIGGCEPDPPPPPPPPTDPPPPPPPPEEDARAPDEPDQAVKDARVDESDGSGLGGAISSLDAGAGGSPFAGGAESFPGGSGGEGLDWAGGTFVGAGGQGGDKLPGGLGTAPPSALLGTRETSIRSLSYEGGCSVGPSAGSYGASGLWALAAFGLARRRRVFRST